MHEVIWIEPAAPAKPAFGAACNGCGVCCTSAPCPIGIVVSGRFRGRCRALVWHAGAAHYRCGVVDAPALRTPRGLRWAAPMLTRLVRRYISAGSGCDCSLEAGNAEASVA